MCKPQYYEINYEINPWMNIQHGVSRNTAELQWQKLYQTVNECQTIVELIEPAHGLPDLIFTANCGLRAGNQIYLSRFKYPQRQGEYEVFKKWFMQAGYQIAAEPAEYFDPSGLYTGPAFEGAGDALFLGKTLFAAHGFRTDKQIYPAVYEKLGISQLLLCELVNPHFYHLDTCFCPLNEHQALWFPSAFSAESQQRMREKAELLAVPAEEERSFACNAIIINQHAIIPERCPQTRKILEKLNFTVHECAMSEFIKSGGACKCLTFDLRTTSNTP
jgi:N-dimethylarginine dimethylaminohydrolase